LKIEKLYDQYGEALYRYLSIKLGSASDAEDVLQEVFCRLIRYSLRLRFVRRPRAFLFQVAGNEANRFLRNKIREQNELRSNPDSASIAQLFLRSYAGPEAQTERLVSAALARLPGDQREVIILKTFEGMTFREIAGICGESINTVASRYRYGIEKMRSFLEEKP
jgi:RNA polymerase sigma-70 factor (ECF subfamily)